ncbi:MAG: hypothetical protein M1814_004549 [Vezdaea aestivalis]|nr:MAG: hypothetical protein M1814_004549 [Vezdaea aestivalis]
MDMFNKLTGSGEQKQGEGQQQQHHQQQQGGQQQGGSGGGFLDGIKDKMNTAAGGGRESEAKEDGLDKGIDFVQEKFLGQGAQDNESAVEQAKDEQISDFIRGQYKSKSGKEFPVADKE